MLLGTWGAGLLGNMLAGKGEVRVGDGVVRASELITRAGEGYEF